MVKNLPLQIAFLLTKLKKKLLDLSVIFSVKIETRVKGLPRSCQAPIDTINALVMVPKTRCSFYLWLSTLFAIDEQRERLF